MARRVVGVFREGLDGPLSIHYSRRYANVHLQSRSSLCVALYGRTPYYLAESFDNQKTWDRLDEVEK